MKVCPRCKAPALVTAEARVVDWWRRGKRLRAVHSVSIDTECERAIAVTIETYLAEGGPG